MSLQTKSLLEGHLSDLSSPDTELAPDLEAALDRGQQHEAFVSKLKQVGRAVAPHGGGGGEGSDTTLGGRAVTWCSGTTWGKGSDMV